MGNCEEYAPSHEMIEFYHFKNLEEKRRGFCYFQVKRMALKISQICHSFTPISPKHPNFQRPKYELYIQIFWSNRR